MPPACSSSACFRPMAERALYEHPASFETPASPAPQDMMPHTNVTHPEERAAGARLEERTALMQGDPGLFLFIIAGEPSGDVLGAALIAALRELTGGRLRVAGIGGEE